MTQENEFKLVCVVALAENGVIGDGEDLIWKLPGDLKRVKELTMGCPLIMGRKTFHSIGRALPGRLNIVLTRNADFRADDIVTVSNLTDAVNAGMKWLSEKNAKQEIKENRLILFGGGEIYRLGLPYCDEIEATIVKDNSRQGVTFPALDPAEWHNELLQDVPATSAHPAFGYHRLLRKNAPTQALAQRLIP